MLIHVLLLGFISVIGALFRWFPVVTALPFGADPYLVAGMGYIRFIAVVFPPIGIMLTGFLFVMSWKLVLLVIKLIPVVRHLLHGPDSFEIPQFKTGRPY